jgi:hypothetical protein
MALILAAGSLSGCGLAASTGLSETEEELVAEYAAGVLMRYVGDKKGGFGNLKPTPIPIVAPPEEYEPVAEASDAGDDEQDPMDDNSTDDSMFDSDTEDASAFSSDGISNAGSGIAEAIGVEGFVISYTGYETAGVYPEAGDDPLSFSMQATEGRKLLVVHLDVKNNAPEDRECDVLDCNVKFRVVINDSTRVNEQMTILLNDLKSFREEIGAGQSVDTVLVFEIDSDLADQISSLSLVVVGAGGESSFSLL